MYIFCFLDLLLNNVFKLCVSCFAADFLDEHRRVLESRLQPVVREITDSRARTREELESLYRKIVSAVLLRSGLGSPTDIAVVREATGKHDTLCLLSVIGHAYA